jgi:hypothetical protein
MERLACMVVKLEEMYRQAYASPISTDRHSTYEDYHVSKAPAWPMFFPGPGGHACK